MIIDIIRLLNKIVPNNSVIPKSIYDIRKLLNINSDQKKEKEKNATTVNICQICETVQISSKKCSNELCNIEENYLRPPYVYTWFNIRQQFEQIIGREKNILSTSGTDTTMPSATIKNILDGRLYKHLICSEKLDGKTRLFTLSLSSKSNFNYSLVPDSAVPFGFS